MATAWYKDKAFLEHEKADHLRQDEERVNQERREDLMAEREVWAGIVQILLEDGKNYLSAIDTADKVLAEYRRRFQ